MTEQAGRRKVQEGRVVSDKMDKTVVVAVERRVQHRLYHKSVRHQSKFKAHDEANTYRVGDLVRIVETRPMSATKRWRVAELLERLDLPDALSTDAEQPVAVSVAAPAPVAAAESALAADEAEEEQQS